MVMADIFTLKVTRHVPQVDLEAAGDVSTIIESRVRNAIWTRV